MNLQQINSKGNTSPMKQISCFKEMVSDRKSHHSTQSSPFCVLLLRVAEGFFW